MAATRGTPVSPHPTRSSAFKHSKKPIYNPFDKFTQPEFDDWIGGITGALRRALGHEVLSERDGGTTSNLAQEVSNSREVNVGFGEDEDVEDSFAEIKARRGKGKARDPREGPGFGGSNQPIEIGSDSDSDGGPSRDGSVDEDQESDEEVYSQRRQNSDPYPHEFDFEGSDVESDEEQVVRSRGSSPGEPIELDYSDEDSAGETEVQNKLAGPADQHFNDDDDGVFQAPEIAPDVAPLAKPDSSSDDVPVELKEDEVQVNDEPNRFDIDELDVNEELLQPIDLPDPWRLPQTYAEDLYSGGDSFDPLTASPDHLTPALDDIGMVLTPFSVPNTPLGDMVNESISADDFISNELGEMDDWGQHQEKKQRLLDDLYADMDFPGAQEGEEDDNTKTNNENWNDPPAFLGKTASSSGHLILLEREKDEDEDIVSFLEAHREEGRAFNGEIEGDEDDEDDINGIVPLGTSDLDIKYYKDDIRQHDQNSEGETEDNFETSFPRDLAHGSDDNIKAFSEIYGDVAGDSEDHFTFVPAVVTENDAINESSARGTEPQLEQSNHKVADQLQNDSQINLSAPLQTTDSDLGFGVLPSIAQDVDSSPIILRLGVDPKNIEEASMVEVPHEAENAPALDIGVIQYEVVEYDAEGTKLQTADVDEDIVFDIEVQVGENVNAEYTVEEPVTEAGTEGRLTVEPVDFERQLSVHSVEEESQNIAPPDARLSVSDSIVADHVEDSMADDSDIRQSPAFNADFSTDRATPDSPRLEASHNGVGAEDEETISDLNISEDATNSIGLLELPEHVATESFGASSFPLDSNDSTVLPTASRDDGPPSEKGNEMIPIISPRLTSFSTVSTLDNSNVAEPVEHPTSISNLPEIIEENDRRPSEPVSGGPTVDDPTIRPRTPPRAPLILSLPGTPNILFSPVDSPGTARPTPVSVAIPASVLIALQIQQPLSNISNEPFTLEARNSPAPPSDRFREGVEGDVVESGEAQSNGEPPFKAPTPRSAPQSEVKPHTEHKDGVQVPEVHEESSVLEVAIPEFPPASMEPPNDIPLVQETQSIYSEGSSVKLSLTRRAPSAAHPTRAVITRKATNPILCADPYPYSLSTPGVEFINPMDEPSEDDPDNSISSSSTMEKEQEDKDSSILPGAAETDDDDDLMNLELQYPSDSLHVSADPRERDIGKANVNRGAGGEINSDFVPKNNNELPVILNAVQNEEDPFKLMGSSSIVAPGAVDDNDNDDDTDSSKEKPSELTLNDDKGVGGSTGNNAAIDDSIQANNLPTKHQEQIPESEEKLKGHEEDIEPVIKLRRGAIHDTVLTESLSVKGNRHDQTSGSVATSSSRPSKRKRNSSIKIPSRLTRSMSSKDYVHQAIPNLERKRNTKGKGKEKERIEQSNQGINKESDASGDGWSTSSGASVASKLLQPGSKPSSRASSVASSVLSYDSSMVQTSPTIPRQNNDPRPSLIHRSSLFHSHATLPHRHQLPSLPASQQQLQRQQVLKPLTITLPRLTVFTIPQPDSSSQPGPPPQTSNSPVTRSNCRYHKISLPIEEGGPRIFFLVPGCSLGDRELMDEQGIEDHGDASIEDSERMIADLDSMDFSSYLIGILRQLVGVDLLREQEVYYLPPPGEQHRKVHRRLAARKSAINRLSSRDIGSAFDSGSVAGSPRTSVGSMRSPVSSAHRAPVSAAGSTSTTGSLILKPRLFEQGSLSGVSMSDSELSDPDDDHDHDHDHDIPASKRARLSTLNQEMVEMPPPTSGPRLKTRHSKRFGAAGDELANGSDEDDAPGESKSPISRRKNVGSHGVKRTRMGDPGAADDEVNVERQVLKKPKIRLSSSNKPDG